MAVELELSLGDSVTGPPMEGEGAFTRGVTEGDTVLLWLPTDERLDRGDDVACDATGVDCDAGDERLRGAGLLMGPGDRCAAGGERRAAAGGDFPATPERPTVASRCAAAGLECAEDGSPGAQEEPKSGGVLEANKRRFHPPQPALVDWLEVTVIE